MITVPWLAPPATTVQYVLCTSGFMDDVVFSHNGANGPESKMFRRVRKVAAPGAKLLSTISGLLAAVVTMIVARNAVTVILAGSLYGILSMKGIRSFTASNHIPAGLPPFKVPEFSIYSPSENRTITTGEIFSVSPLCCALRFTRSP